jgi:hypothetical protein
MHLTQIVSLHVANMEDADKDSDNESDEDSAILRGLMRDEEACHSGIPLDDDDDEDKAPNGGIIDDTLATGPPPAADKCITEATPPITAPAPKSSRSRKNGNEQQKHTTINEDHGHMAIPAALTDGSM